MRAGCITDSGRIAFRNVTAVFAIKEAPNRIGEPAELPAACWARPAGNADLDAKCSPASPEWRGIQNAADLHDGERSVRAGYDRFRPD